MHTRFIRRSFRSLFLPSNRLFYLAVFRVVAGMVILCKILALWPNTKLLFGANGLYVRPHDSVMSVGFIPQSLIWDHLFLFYVFYASAAALMIFGIGHRWTIAVVIIATHIHQDLNWFLLDGGDNLLKFSLIYLGFANSFAFLTMSKTEPPRQEYAISHFLTNVAVAALIGHLCLVYLVSGLSKAHAEVWYNGTAMYYILLAERFQGTKTWNAIFANSVLFNVIVCYTTIVWESTFCFAVFVKKLRFPVLLMGVAMHLSIFVLMMIQSFQFIYICHYGFFFTDEEWLTFLARIRSSLRRSPPSPQVTRGVSSPPESGAVTTAHQSAFLARRTIPERMQVQT